MGIYGNPQVIGSFRIHSGYIQVFWNYIDIFTWNLFALFFGGETLQIPSKKRIK